ncbi:LOW QUALITY PROTEIN: hypothetical protein MXB_2490 [Myxobolus squamalis]|nr:LOW QUALITY PROTEIN: hypothetical protein MXB_2490 [Myxobolus squamalis]
MIDSHKILFSKIASVFTKLWSRTLFIPGVKYDFHDSLYCTNAFIKVSMESVDELLNKFESSTVKICQPIGIMTKDTYHLSKDMGFIFLMCVDHYAKIKISTENNV